MKVKNSHSSFSCKCCLFKAVDVATFCCIVILFVTRMTLKIMLMLLTMNTMKKMMLVMEVKWLFLYLAARWHFIVVKHFLSNHFSSLLLLSLKLNNPTLGINVVKMQRRQKNVILTEKIKGV